LQALAFLRGSWNEGRESCGGWRSGEWNRMGRYGEEGWPGQSGGNGYGSGSGSSGHRG
jgi:hypothetical protein